MCVRIIYRSVEVCVRVIYRSVEVCVRVIYRSKCGSVRKVYVEVVEGCVCLVYVYIMVRECVFV